MSIKKYIVDALQTAGQFLSLFAAFLLGCINTITSPPKSQSHGKCHPRIVTLLLAVVILYVGVYIGSFHYEYLHPWDVSGYLKFLPESFRAKLQDTSQVHSHPDILYFATSRPDVPIKHLVLAENADEHLQRLSMSAGWYGDEIQTLNSNSLRSLMTMSQRDLTVEMATSFSRYQAIDEVEQTKNVMNVMRDGPLSPDQLAMLRKLHSLLEYTESLSPDTLMMSTSAENVLLLGPHSEAVEGYKRAVSEALSKEASASPSGSVDSGRSTVLLGTQGSIYSSNLAGLYTSSDRNEVFPFISSNLMIMGNAGAIAQVIRSLSYDVLFKPSGNCILSALSYLYRDSLSDPTLPRIVLDHSNYVFATISEDENQLLERDLTWDVRQKRWYHIKTNGYPSVVQFSSSPSPYIDAQAQKMWFLLQGHNNNVCGTYLCVPLYTIRTLAVFLPIGMLIGLFWNRCLQNSKLGRTALMNGASLEGFAKMFKIRDNREE